MVSGLSYFSLDSGCLCLTSVLIFLICFSSVCLLFFFCLDSGFLIQGSSVLILPVLLLSCNEQMGIPETRKSRYPEKGTPKTASVLQSQCRSLKTLSLTYPEPVASESKCANSPRECAHLHVGTKCTFLAHKCCKARPAPHNSRKNLYQQMPENQGFRK